jgi:hypothetical protein
MGSICTDVGVDFGGDEKSPDNKTITSAMCIAKLNAKGVEYFDDTTDSPGYQSLNQQMVHLLFFVTSPLIE